MSVLQALVVMISAQYKFNNMQYICIESINCYNFSIVQNE